MFSFAQRIGILSPHVSKSIKRPTDLFDNPLVLSTVLASLQNPDNNVRAAVLDTVRKVKGVEQRPEFHTAMEQLQNDANPRLRLIAVSVLQGKKLSDALGSVLDFNYFVAKIEPIPATQGADGGTSFASELALITP